MTKTLIDVDDRVLAEAADLLGTSTKKATVDTALRKVLDDHRRDADYEAIAEITGQPTEWIAPRGTI